MVACKAVDNYMYKQVAWCEDEFHVDPLPIAKGDLQVIMAWILNLPDWSHMYTQ